MDGAVVVVDARLAERVPVDVARLEVLDLDAPRVAFDRQDIVLVAPDVGPRDRGTGRNLDVLDPERVVERLHVDLGALEDDEIVRHPAVIGPVVAPALAFAGRGQAAAVTASAVVGTSVVIQLPDDPAELVGGDWTKLVYSIRQDISWKLLDQAVITDPTNSNAIVLNLAQQDAVALRVTFRAGWALPQPASRVAGDTRFPFASLVGVTSS